MTASASREWTPIRVAKAHDYLSLLEEIEEHYGENDYVYTAGVPTVFVRGNDTITTYLILKYS